MSEANARIMAARKSAAQEKANAAQRAKEVAKSVKSYVNNVTSTYKRWDELQNAPARTPESGQFWGAVLQNRTYDVKTGKQITGETQPYRKISKKK